MIGWMATWMESRRAPQSESTPISPCVVERAGDKPSGLELMLGHRAPIAELMKTPSRTQTIKKTRATTVAGKDRTEKIKGLNARLGLSPVTVKMSYQVRSLRLFNAKDGLTGSCSLANRSLPFSHDHSMLLLPRQLPFSRRLQQSRENLFPTTRAERPSQKRWRSR